MIGNLIKNFFAGRARPRRPAPANAGADLFSSGMAAYNAGRLNEALDCIERAVAAAPPNPDYFAWLAVVNANLGDAAGARAALDRAVAIDPNHRLARGLSEILLQPGGESYMEVIKRIHAYLKPSTYLEVGVATGTSLALVAEDTMAIGIDPDPQIDIPLPAAARVFKETSDDFFAKYDVRKEFEGRTIDLAFIDGMHHFEFALRDFMNIEKNCAPDSTILIHDCYPLGEITAARERTTDFWSGDIWKLIACLRKYRPDLDVHVVLTPPTGLGIVRKLDPSSRFIGENLQRLYDEFIPQGYGHIKTGKDARLNAVANDWAAIRAFLA